MLSGEKAAAGFQKDITTAHPPTIWIDYWVLMRIFSA